ncbi:MAG: alr, partial [Francisellaceae bacterium]|nr:alr [Francisellaceae bacterium]
YYPNENIPTNLNKVLPCLNIKAKVSYFKIIKKGDGLGYNHTFIAPKDTRIITIPLGYGDGLRRSLSNKAQILLNGKRYPIVGNICMDQFMVDIGDDSAYVGDIITIIGNDQNESITIKELSNLCETIPYEILCGFNNRLPRLYQSEKGNLWEHEVYNPLSSTKVY